MKLFDELKRATELLHQHRGQWALCGGVAASIYRNKPRFTDDIDFALIDSEKYPAETLATEVIKKLGYKEYIGFVPDPKIDGQQLRGLICARGTNDERFVGFDFLLPVQFWVTEAVTVAQSNLIDFGFAKLPTITPESLILAKLVAATSSPNRYQDLDDIKEIAASVAIDIDYLKAQIAKHGIQITPSLLQLVF